MKSILFDLDGTLLNSNQLVLNIYKQLFEEFKITFIWNKKSETMLLTKSYITVFESVFAQPITDLIPRLLDIYKRLYQDELSLYPGTKEMLETLKERGYHLGLVTSEIKAITDLALKLMEIDCFDDVICFEDVTKEKPDPDGLLRLIDKRGFEKKDVLFIGDHLSDAKAGKMAGIQTGMMIWDQKHVKRMKKQFDYQWKGWHALLEDLEKKLK